MTALTPHGRERLVEVWKEVGSISKAANIMKVSRATARKWIKREEKNAGFEDKRRSGRPRLVSKVAASKAIKLLLKNDGGGLKGAARKLLKKRSTEHEVSASTLLRAVNKRSQERKLQLKVHTGKPKKALSTSNKKKRLEFAWRHLGTNWSTLPIM